MDDTPRRMEYQQSEQTYLWGTFAKRMTWMHHITPAEAKARNKEMYASILNTDLVHG